MVPPLNNVRVQTPAGIDIVAVGATATITHTSQQTLVTVGPLTQAPQNDVTYTVSGTDAGNQVSYHMNLDQGGQTQARFVDRFV